MVVSGCVGPRGDGYVPGEVMSADEAEAYHAPQISAFAEAGADMVSAVTMTNASEAIGVARAAATGGPAGIALLHRGDRRPPADRPDAGRGDRRGRRRHVERPRLLHDQLRAPDALRRACCGPKRAWTRRIGGIRANASRRSHQELNESPDLDAGNPIELGGQYRDLVRVHAPDQRAGRLLRHRPSPRRRHQPRLPAGRATGGLADVSPAPGRRSRA